MTIRKRVLAAYATFLLIAACGGGNGGGGGGGSQSYTVGGSVSGLAGTGLVLQDNGGDDLMASSDGNFVFATAVASGGAYAVTVKSQPSNPSQTCTAAGGVGSVATADVSDVVVTCVTNVYKVSVTVSGLAGTGLVLRDNAADNLAVGANGTFAFATAVKSGAVYAVSVKTQPSVLSQACSVAGGSGIATDADISINVTCVTNSYAVGGTVSGLIGSGLALQDNGADPLTISANGTFQFAHPLLSGTTYAVSIMTQPGTPAQACTLASGSGSVVNANVTNVVVTCAAALACGLENGTVVTHTGNVTADETWAGNGTVHLIANTIEIAAPATLTIQKCAIVKLNTAVQIVVSGNPSGGVATLIAEGDNEASGFVLFKSAIEGQYWNSLVGANKNSIIELYYSVLNDGGNGGGAARNATITMNGSSTLPDAVLKVVDISIQQMAGAGIYLNDAAFTTDSTMLTVFGSPDYPIALSAMALGSIPPYHGVTNSPDEALVIGNANIFDNLTIHKRLPIHFKTDGVRVAGAAPTFKPNITLTLDAGVVLKFEPVSGASPPMVTFGSNGQTTDENATLIANGTATDPVIFTSGAATPAPGDWAGLWLLTSNGSQLTNVTIEYAGGNAGVGPHNCGPVDMTSHLPLPHTAALFVGDGTDQQYVPPAGLITNSTFQNNAGNFAIDSVWEATTFGPNLKATNTFTSPGLVCQQSKNLIPLGCTVGGVDESGCLP